MKAVAISGPSCSGKSTLARHLARVVPGAMLLYQDDFYLPDSQIPLTSSGVQNWDCPEAFDLDRMATVIASIKQSGHYPEGYKSIEQHNDRGERFLTSEVEASLRSQLTASGVEPILIIDGIMLFHENSPLLPLFDVMILMPAEYTDIKCRREARAGYTTIEGYWTDPPGYFDNIVWPEFLRWYGYLYTGSDEVSAEGTRLGIQKAPATKDLVKLTTWVVSLIN